MSYPESPHLSRDRSSRWGGLVAVALVMGACASTPQTSEDDRAETTPSPSEERASKAEETSSSEKTRESASEQTTSESPWKSRESSEKTSLSLQEKLERATKRARKGDTSGAVETLEQLTEHPEKGYLAVYNLGVVAEMNGDAREAARRYNQTLETRAGFTPALNNLVRLYLRQGRVDDADRVAEKYIEKSPNNVDHRAVKLDVLLAREQYSDVVRRAKSLLRRDQKNVEAMLAMSMANYRLERYELARAILDRASELAPERADIYFQYGLIAMENERRSRAIANFKKALEMRPRFAEAHNNLGLLYHEAGDYESAADRFKTALKYYPDFKEARLNLGNALKRLGQPEKAKAQFERVLELDSNYADAYFNLGLLYMDTKVSGMKKIPRLKKAIEMLNEYKRVSRGQLASNDPANKYIKSAREKIKAEKQRRRMMRQNQKSSSSSSSSNSGSDSGNEKSNSGTDSGTKKEGTSDSTSSGSSSSNVSSSSNNGSSDQEEGNE